MLIAAAGELKCVVELDLADESEQSVGLVVVRNEASEHATTAATTELAKVGLSRVVVVEVALAGMLAGASKVSE